MSNINYFKLYKDRVEMAQQLNDEIICQKYDYIQDAYYNFFIKGILKSLIESCIKKIDLDNYSFVTNQLDFKMKIREEKKCDMLSNGQLDEHWELRGLVDDKLLFYPDPKLKFDDAQDVLFQYILDSLYQYGLNDVELSLWHMINSSSMDDPKYGNYIDYSKRDRYITFSGTLKQLIEMYYMELQKYEYENQSLVKVKK